MSVKDLFEKACRLKEELAQVNELLRAASVAELVPFVAADIRPEVIPVWEKGEGECTVLLRSPKTPEFAFVLWGKGQHSVQWSLTLRLSDQSTSRCFWLQCGCCAGEFYGLKKPEASDEEAWQDTVTTSFIADLARVCKEHEIKGIFVRKAERWKERYGEMEGVRVHEANQYLNVMSDAYGRKTIEEAMSFLGKGTCLS